MRAFFRHVASHESATASHCDIMLDFGIDLPHSMTHMTRRPKTLSAPLRSHLRHKALAAAFAFGLLSTSTLGMALLPQDALAATAEQRIDTIDIKGYERIEASTILSYFGLRENQQVSSYDVDKAVKALFATGFFADVSADMVDGKLTLRVLENPMVNRVVFEGNKYFEDEDLEKEIQLKPRSIYTRPRIQSDVSRLLEIYRRSGRFSAKVTPKLISRDQNRVDIVFEISEGEVTRVAGINFIGNEQFSSATLRDVIKTSEECWYCFITDFDKYDPDRLLVDEEMLRKFYTSQGYADFDVKSSVAELSSDKKSFYITFTMDEGKRYDFGEITFKSELPGTDTKKFKELITTETGELYNAEEVETSIDAMVDELGNQGFAFVDIEPQLERLPDGKTINLAYEIQEGPRVYVERIDITGNVRTLDEVVRREFRLAEGDPYSTDKLRRSEQRLRNLGFFEDVKISNEAGTAADKTKINVDVKEASTGEVTLGAGFSSTDGALADIGIREKNLLGRGQDLRLRGMFATRRQQYDLGFTEPYFMGREVAAGFDLFRITQDFRSESSFDRESNGGRLRAGYAITEHLRQNVRYSYEETDITNIREDASRFVKDQEGTNVTSLVGQSLIYDRRDNSIDPTEGYYAQFDTDVAGLGGDSKFVRPEVKSAVYYSLAPQWTTSLVGTGGYVIPLDDRNKIQDRFFIGGKNFRGFDNSGIGPRDITTNDALGGNVYYVASVEQSFPLGLPDDLGFKGAVFVDAGSLWDVDETGPEVADSSALRASAGFGVAWRSPFGPIRVDIAVPFLKEDYDEEELFQFNFGTRF